jgi:hypothetical protein
LFLLALTVGLAGSPKAPHSAATLLAAFAGTTGAAVSVGTVDLAAYVPATVSANRLDASTCRVTWTAAGTPGPPSGLRYDVTDGTSTLATSVAGLSVDLATGAQVTPRVKARLGTWISATATVSSASCPGLPGAPAGATATPGDGQVTVSWTAPSDGGSAISGYTVSGSGGSCTTTNTTCTVTGLTNGTTYSFTVTATNAVGAGVSSTAVSAAPYPATIMSAARLSLWLDGADTSTMFTDAAGTTPATTAGDQVMRWNDKSSANGYVSAPTSGNAATLTSLGGRLVPGFNGTSSYLSLANVGQLPSGSAASSEIAVATSDEANPASSTYRFVWERGNTSAFGGRAIWKGSGTAQMKADMKSGGVAAAGTIGSNAPLVAIAQYASNVLTFSTAGRAGVTAGGTMATGTTYAYLGHNSSTFYWSGPIPEVIVLNTTLTATEERSVEEYLSRKWGSVITPAAPTGVSATAGDTAATVSWSPGYSGGATATFTATASPGGATCSTTGSSCQITGLTNGTTYTVSVTGSNTAGTGIASSSVSVTPRTVPGAPTGVTLTPGNGQLAVSWSAPASNGGSAITGYTASTNTGATCTTASTSCTLTGLTNGTSYTVTVYATNAAGNGPASGGVSGTPGLLANGGFETGTLAGWSCSANDAIVTSPAHTGTYAVTATYVNPDKARCSQTISGLTPGGTYSFKMWANGTGMATIGYTAGGNSGSFGNGVSGAWSQLSATVIVPAGVTSATVYFETTGTVTFDDATLS